MMGICQLCKKEKELIKRSHIWPDFMYKGMYDAKGRLYVLNSADLTKHQTVQSGSHQSGIFCSQCDNVALGKLERYASNYLFRKPYLAEGPEFKQVKVARDMDLIYCQKLDYNQFKRFLLSLLWRASISKEALFENFKLSEEQEEFLRECIYSEAVVDEAIFPCVMMTAEVPEQDENFIAIDATKPELIKFYINSFVYTYYLDGNENEMVRQLAIGMDKKMGILRASKEQWQQIRDSIINGTIAHSKNPKL